MSDIICRHGRQSRACPDCATDSTPIPVYDLGPTTGGLIPCPRCPDGSIWTANGPTGATCPVCGGYAALNRDGSQLTKADLWGEEEREQ